MIVTSIFGTLAILIALFVTIGLAAATGFFTSPPLRGPDTMGYASVFIAVALRWVLIAVAAIACLSRGSFDWVSRSPGVPSVIVLASLVGLAVIIGLSWIQWTAPAAWYTIPAGNIGALLLPVLLQGYLLVALWVKPEQLTSSLWPKAVGVPLAAIGAAGLIVGGVIFFQAQIQSARRDQAGFEERLRNEQQNERDNAARIAKQAADLDLLSDEQPLEQFLPHLFIDKTEHHQKRAVARMRLLPNLTAQLERALSVPDPMQREYAANFVRMCDNPDPAWAPIVANAIRLLSHDIAAAPALYDPVTMRSFRGMTLGMVLTARRFPGHDFSAEVGKVRAAALLKVDDESRAEVLKLVDAFLAGQPLG